MPTASASLPASSTTSRPRRDRCSRCCRRTARDRQFYQIVQRLPVQIHDAEERREAESAARRHIVLYRRYREGAADADSETDLDSPLMIHPR